VKRQNSRVESTFHSLPARAFGPLCGLSLAAGAASGRASRGRFPGFRRRAPCFRLRRPRPNRHKCGFAGGAFTGRLSGRATAALAPPLRSVPARVDASRSSRRPRRPPRVQWSWRAGAHCPATARPTEGAERPARWIAPVRGGRAGGQRQGGTRRAQENPPDGRAAEERIGAGRPAGNTSPDGTARSRRAPWIVERPRLVPRLLRAPRRHV
jgi:hypothetical protein